MISSAGYYYLLGWVIMVVVDVYVYRIYHIISYISYHILYLSYHIVSIISYRIYHIISYLSYHIVSIISYRIYHIVSIILYIISILLWLGDSVFTQAKHVFLINVSPHGWALINSPCSKFDVHLQPIGPRRDAGATSRPRLFCRACAGLH
jgi:hypothetical protein